MTVEGRGCFRNDDPNRSYCIERNDRGGYDVRRYDGSSGRSTSAYDRAERGDRSNNGNHHVINSLNQANSQGTYNRGQQAQPNYEPSPASTQRMAATVLKLEATTKQHNVSLASLNKSVQTLENGNISLADFLAKNGTALQKAFEQPQKAPAPALDCSLKGYHKAAMEYIGTEMIEEARRIKDQTFLEGLLDGVSRIIQANAREGSDIQNEIDDFIFDYSVGLIKHKKKCDDIQRKK